MRTTSAIFGSRRPWWWAPLRSIDLLLQMEERRRDDIYPLAPRYLKTVRGEGWMLQPE